MSFNVTVQKQSQFEKVTVQKSIVEFLTVTSDHMMKYQLPHSRLNQTSHDYYEIYLYEKLSTKLLAQATKIIKQTLPKCNLIKVTVQKPPIGLWNVTSVHKSNKLLRRPSLLNQKHNVGWFLLRRFVNLGRV